ncbi:M24 family metallopeptidase [Candidatus Poriferisodalis sp.]|uniref:M24 family metallopeptidase n=1 Tax=Candidatus Poriferisodalis sp. TaxID=3101277 RepID=UPI003B022820
MTTTALPEPTTAPPDETEIGGRLDRVRARMREEGLDLLVVVDPHSVYYLTNFANYVHERPFVLVVPLEGSPRMVVPLLERQHVEVRSVGAIELVSYYEFPAPAGEKWTDRFHEVVDGATAVGVESNCPLYVIDELDGNHHRSDIVEDVRMIKSDYEIGRMVHAAQVVSDAHASVMAAVKPGDTMATLAGAASSAMRARTLADMPNANLLASSFGAAIQPPMLSDDPHNFTDVFAVMEEGGPHVSVINSVVNGYGAEIERTFFLNTVPDAAHEPFEVMMEARRTAFDLTVPGASMAGVDQAVREVFVRHGCLDRVVHRTGHSFGVTGHEGPFLAISYDHEIEPGMVFSIEPGIYFAGLGGFRHSDTVLVTETGNVSLTTAPDSLDDLLFAR